MAAVLLGPHPVLGQEAAPAQNAPAQPATPPAANAQPPAAGAGTEGKQTSPAPEQAKPTERAEGETPAEQPKEEKQLPAGYEAYTFLFNTDVGFASELDQRIIPDGLRREFAVNRSSLSQSATVSVEIPGRRWVIDDVSRDYVILKQEERLGVYLQPRLVQRVPRPEFSVEPLRDLRPFGYDFFSQPPSSFAPVAETPVPATYALGPGDKLKIRYWSPVRTETVEEVTVNPTGDIYLPVAGLLTVQGLTFDQAKKVIADALKRYYRNLEVEVTLTELRALRVFVAGEAARPGAYTLSALSTTFNALYVAGGPNARGSMRNIRLIRRGKEAGVIDLYEYLLTGNRSIDFELQQDDTVFIPVIGPVVAVYGAVKRPALYELRGGERLKDAIELAGGPLSSAFLGRVQVDRVEHGVRRVIRDVSLAEVLSKDDDQNNLLLQDGDAIGLFEVPSRRGGAVQIEGPVEKPGSYELSPGMRVSDLIARANGLRPDVEIYQQRADILRLLPDTRLQRIAVDLPKALAKDPEKDLLLQEYDRLILYTGEDIPLHDYVEVRGNVERPGLYQRTEKMKVSDLLFVAGLPQVSTFRERADLIRTRPDETTEIIPVNLAKIESGETSADIELKDRDVLRVYTVAEADAEWGRRWVTIAGAVQRPDRYPRQENMTLKDLIFAAGGLLPEAASEAEIARPQGDRTIILKSDLDALFQSGDERQNVLLQNQDHVLVKTRNEYVTTPATVTLSGEFRFPGTYALSGKRERLSTILQRAGGVTPEAFLEGAVFRRRLDTLIVPDLTRQADQVKENMEAVTRKRYEAYVVAQKGPYPPSLTAAQAAKEAGTTAFTQAATVAAAGEGVAAVAPRPIGEIVQTQRLAIDLVKVFEGKQDLYLENGDTLFVPKRPTTVVIAGAVVNPGPLLFEGENPVSYYVQRCGGYSADASPARSVVIRANGIVEPVEKAKKLRLGDILVVPTRPMIYKAKKDWLETFGQFAGIVANVASTAYILLSINN